MGHASSCYSRWSIASLLVALIGLGTPANAQAQRYSVTDLGTLGGGTSKGYGINASGQVTGEAVTAGGVLHAFLYTPGSGMSDLGTLGGGSSKGYGINASGQVTGEAVTAGGMLHAFLYAKRVMRDLNSMIDPATAAYMRRWATSPAWQPREIGFCSSTVGMSIGRVCSALLRLRSCSVRRPTPRSTRFYRC